MTLKEYKMTSHSWKAPIQTKKHLNCSNCSFSVFTCQLDKKVRLKQISLVSDKSYRVIEKLVHMAKCRDQFVLSLHCQTCSKWLNTFQNTLFFLVQLNTGLNFYSSFDLLKEEARKSFTIPRLYDKNVYDALWDIAFVWVF